MKKKISKKIFATLFVILACFVVISVLQFFKGQNTFGAATGPSVHTKGNPQAPIKIIEYMDFECPACGYGARLLNTFIKNNPDKFHLEVRYYPLDMHIHAMRAARYAECAGRQNKFWPMHDLLFEQQSYWSKVLSPEHIFGEMAKTLQLDPQKLEQCLTDTAVNDRILQDKEKGKSQDVKSTPSYFINDKMLVGTSNLEKELKSSLESLTNSVSQ